MDDTTANRLVTELMLVSVLVAGEGQDELAVALERAGAAAETLATSSAAGGYDLAVFSAPASADGQDGLVAALSQLSERLLLIPTVPQGEAPPDLSGLAAWFETFIELGYQPVVDFDAGFVAPGAFLVDRAATAGEAELAAFADRLQAAPARPDPAPAPQAAPNGDLNALAAQLHAQEAQLAELAGRAANAEVALQDEATRNAGWDGLRSWVNFSVRDPARNTAEALARDLPRLAALRGTGDWPPGLPAAAPVARRGWLGMLLRRMKPAVTASTPSVLADAALVRASRFFDPAWYIASSAELAAGETVDPVFHYLLVGGPRGADPSPWFDTAAYLDAHSAARGSGQAPLVHAIRSGAPEVADDAPPRT